MKFFDPKRIPITFSFSNFKAKVRLINGFLNLIIETPTAILLVPFFASKASAQFNCVKSDSIIYNNSYFIDWQNQAAILIKYALPREPFSNGDCGFEVDEKPMGNYSLIDCSCFYNGSDDAYNPLLLYGQNITDSIQTCVMEILDQCSPDNSNFIIFFLLEIFFITLVGIFLGCIARSIQGTFSRENKYRTSPDLELDDRASLEIKDSPMHHSGWLSFCSRKPKNRDSSDSDMAYRPF